jgi:hypothetical protein
LVSAVREAVIKFEDIVQKKSGLKDLKSSDLMEKHFLSNLTKVKIL